MNAHVVILLVGEAELSKTLSSDPNINLKNSYKAEEKLLSALPSTLW